MEPDEEEEEEERWLKIDEPPTGRVSSKQEQAIRQYAQEEGYETLRGYHMHLKALGWDYYDVLKAFYWP